MLQEKNKQIMDDVRRDTNKLRQDESAALAAPATRGSGSKFRNKSNGDTGDIREYLAFLRQASEIEEDTTPTSSPQITAKIVSAEKLRQDYQKKISAESDFISPECEKLRILILGQAGIGKSTLCSMILGISHKQVS